MIGGAVDPFRQVGDERVVERDRPDADLLAERGDLLDAERGGGDAERRDGEQRLDLGRQRAVAVDGLVADVRERVVVAGGRDPPVEVQAERLLRRPTPAG